MRFRGFAGFGEDLAVPSKPTNVCRWRLTLRTAAGAPARGVGPRFWNRTAREHYVHDRRTDEHGVVEVELSAGDYEVQLGELGPEGTTIGTVAIRPGERAEARLSLSR